MNFRTVFSVLILFLSFFSCKSNQSSPDYNPTTTSERVGTLYYGDFSSQKITVTADGERAAGYPYINLTKISGIPGMTEIRSIAGIQAFKIWNKKQAFAYTEKDPTHQLWLVVNYGDMINQNWIPMQISGLADEFGKTLSGTYTYLNNPIDVATKHFQSNITAGDTATGHEVNTNALRYAGASGKYDEQVLFFTNSKNKSIEWVRLPKTADDQIAYKELRNLTVLDVDGDLDQPLGIVSPVDNVSTNPSGTELYVTSYNKAVYKITVYGYTTYLGNKEVPVIYASSKKRIIDYKAITDTKDDTTISLGGITTDGTYLYYILCHTEGTGTSAVTKMKIIQAPMTGLDSTTYATAHKVVATFLNAVPGDTASPRINSAAWKGIEYYTPDNGTTKKLYLTDSGSGGIYEVDISSFNGTEITLSSANVFAGTPALANGGDTEGVKTESKFRAPYGLTVDRDYNVMYITDNTNKNIKYITSMNSSPTTVKTLGINARQTEFMYDPIGITTPTTRGKDVDYIYAASGSGYVLKRINITNNYAVDEKVLSGSPYGLWDIKVVEEEYEENGVKRRRDRYIFAVEVHKTADEARITVYDLEYFDQKVLYTISGENFGKNGASITLNETATMIWAAGRYVDLEGNRFEGKIYQMPIKYESETNKAACTKESDDTALQVLDKLPCALSTEPAVFLQKVGYNALSVAYMKDNVNNANYLFVTSYRFEEPDRYKACIDRFPIKTVRGDVNIDPDGAIYCYWISDGHNPLDANEDSIRGSINELTQFMTVSGKYLYFVNMWNTFAGEDGPYRLYIIDGTQSAALSRPSNTTGVGKDERYELMFDNRYFRAIGVAVDGPRGKIYFTSDQSDLITVR